jgi:hypothetical protein
MERLVTCKLEKATCKLRKPVCRRVAGVRGVTAKLARCAIENGDVFFL